MFSHIMGVAELSILGCVLFLANYAFVVIIIWFNYP